MTFNQKLNYNRMLKALRRIASYQSPKQMRKHDGDWGLSYQEALEMAYENMQVEARHGAKNIRAIQLKRALDDVHK
jgi:hypothetical protein